MPVALDDIEKFQISADMRTTADYFANFRILFDYPRPGYGSYDRGHIQNIINGYLGEFAFLKYVYNHLNSTYGSYPPEQRYALLQQKQFEYNLIIGKPDPGYDFKVGTFEIDVKNYGTKMVAINKVMNLNLLIDETQIDPSFNYQNRFFIQSFILDTKEIALAGFHKGLPPLNTNFPNPAYACSVSELSPMRDIFNSNNLNL